MVAGPLTEVAGSIGSGGIVNPQAEEVQHCAKETPMAGKIRIAHLAGPNATIQNTPPLVTANKARLKHQLPLRCGPDGTPLRYDVLRPQRLAAPAKVYVEQFSAHPLEGDAAELYGPPDGYLGADGTFASLISPAIGRFTKSSCGRTTAITRSHIWPYRLMVRPGRRSARSHSPLKPRPGSPFCLTGRVASRRSTGWA